MDYKFASLEEMTAQIVESYVTHNKATPENVVELVGIIGEALKRVGLPEEEPVPTYERATAAQVRKSMTDDGLVSFIDGRTYKTLKRHLSTNGMTPAEYRERYGLPDSYPITSPAYSARRSELAKSAGLGQKGRAAKASAAPAKRGRSKS